MNNNDFKYIIKRVLVFIIISMILFCFNSCKAKAETIVANGYLANTTDINNTNALVTREKTYNIAQFSGKKNGEVYFAMSISRSMEVQNIYVIESNSGLHFTCFFGSITGYANNNEQYQAYSVRCPTDFKYGQLAGIGVNGYVHGNAIINWPTDISYYTYDTSQSVINAIQESSSSTAINNMNNQIHQDNQTINNSINNQTQQQHQDSQAINNSINDTTPVSNNEISGNTSDWNSNNLQNGTITQLLTLPITLIQAYLNGINSNCSRFNLGSLFGTDLILPCINVSNYLGTALWSTIDILFSGFMILNIGRKLIKIFNDFTNLNSNQAEELYGGGA